MTEPVESVCEQCGQYFERHRRDARFCSAACRQASYRARAIGGGFCTVRLAPDITDEIDEADRERIVNDLLRKYLFRNEA